MASKYLLWIVVVAAVAVLGIYFLTQDRGSAPGQPSPHAIDQSP